MGRMPLPATRLAPDQWKKLDDLVRRVDEDRWLSSRYADTQGRNRLVALYAFVWELARVRVSVREPGLGLIRFQWWRDALEEVATGTRVRAHETLYALVETGLAAAAPLSALVDGYEAAFESGQRTAEPEGLVMEIAADALATTAWAGCARAGLAFAAARRGELTQGPGELARIPSAIRPAVAHAALWRVYVRASEPSALSRRFGVLSAMLSGRI
jgi:phytoene synthase